jgi:hypothetical protein
MKVSVAPPSTVVEAPKEQTPASTQKPPEFAPAPAKAPAAKGKAVPLEVIKKDRDMPASLPPASVDEAIRKEDKRIRDEAEPLANKSMIDAKQKETAQDKLERTTTTSTRERQQELSKPNKEYKAAPLALGAAMKKLEQIGITVHVPDVSIAAGEIETLLGKFNARQIQRQSHDDKNVLTAVIHAQDLRELIEKIKIIGKTKEKEIPTRIQKNDISIAIEIIRDH